MKRFNFHRIGLGHILRDPGVVSQVGENSAEGDKHVWDTNMADVLLLLNTNNGRCDVEGNPRHVCYISLWHKINYFRGNHRVREKFSYPLVPRTSTLLNLSKIQEFLSKMFCHVPKPSGGSGAHKNK